MKRRILMAVIILSLALCPAAMAAEETEAPAPDILLEDDGTGEAVENDDLTKIPFLTDRDIDFTVEAGPILCTVTGAQLADITPRSDIAARLMGLEKDQTAALIAVAFRIENTAEETIHFEPQFGTIVTNTKEQATPNLFMSDDVGGAFLGQVIKEGQVYFFCPRSAAEDITEITLHMDPPRNDGLDHFGEEIVLTIAVAE